MRSWLKGKEDQKYPPTGIESGSPRIEIQCATHELRWPYTTLSCPLELTSLESFYSLRTKLILEPIQNIQRIGLETTADICTRWMSDMMLLVEQAMISLQMMATCGKSFWSVLPSSRPEEKAYKNVFKLLRFFWKGWRCQMPLFYIQRFTILLIPLPVKRLER